VSSVSSPGIRCLAIAVPTAPKPPAAIVSGSPPRITVPANTGKKNVNNKLSVEENGCESRPTPQIQSRARAITIKNLRIFSLPSSGLLSMLPGTSPRRPEEIL
jgi:hypothetical protein